MFVNPCFFLDFSSKIKKNPIVIFFFFKYLPVCFEQGSAADGPRGLSVGDIVTGLEDCPVKGVEDWSSCLFHLSHTPQTGYCVPVASLQPSWAHGRGERAASSALSPT